jgi:Tfp pilus assembly protein PilX
MRLRTPLQLFRDERGVALPVALAVLFVTAGLATVAARSAIVADHQSLRDRNAKRAIQSATSGLQDAVYQMNMLQPSANQCVAKTAPLSAVAVQTNGWCAAQTEDLGDGAQYSHQVSQAASVTVNGFVYDQRTIVSTGTVNGVVRRASLTINAATGSPLFPPGYVIATQNSIDIKNNTKVTGGLASNGNITLKNNADVCGPITAGVGKTYSYGNNTTVCPGYSTAPATTPFVFQPVDQGTSRTVNDNIRITRAITGSSTTPKDTCSGCSKITLDSNRVLTINSGGTLTLTGDLYNFCKLNLNGGDLQIPVRTTTMKIFIDTPENCSAVGSTAGSVYFKGGGEFVNLASNPALVALFVAGSATKATTVELSSNDSSGSTDVSLAIYAPNSTVDYANNLKFVGALVSKSLTLKNNSQLTYDSRVAGITSGSNSRYYQSFDYKECASSPTTSTPSSGC